ncbi:MAG: AAA family ATPase [Chloroflexi bacterium]|nr:AAA family ATPase [Chloroflexota bacterium]
MVDIQSLIWICYQQSVVQQGDDSNKTKLAEPFSQIFIDRKEAEWAFDFLQEAFERLGIKNSDDQRFALTLARRFGGLNLHFNLGNWLVLGFRGPNLRRERVRLPLFTEQIDFEQYAETFNIGQERDFAQNPAEPQIAGYGLPIEPVKSMEDNLQTIYEATLDYIAQRFRHYSRCPWRNKHHVTEIAQAIFDLKKREELFTKGFGREIGAIIEEDESDEDQKMINQTLSLSQLAAETGFDEAELARWVRAIERKGQAILYGPPGTGKTFVAEKLATHLVGGGDGFWELVQFHPAYAYEDFIQGIRPQSEGDHLSYPLAPGRFVEFCHRAQACRDTCVLIIDEINRANLSRVFGELMYLLEYRERAIPLAGGGLLQIPANVRLIGTMNTADRSIALVDHALRRRFAFLALYPNYDLLRRYHQKTGFSVEGLINLLQKLNQSINDRHYEVGVTFFLRSNLVEEIEDIWRMEIEPYLEEYFFDRPDTVEEFRWAKVKDRIL